MFLLFLFLCFVLAFFWRGSIYIDDREVDEKALAGGWGGVRGVRGGDWCGSGEGAEGKVQGAGGGVNKVS